MTNIIIFLKVPNPNNSLSQIFEEKIHQSKTRTPKPNKTENQHHSLAVEQNYKPDPEKRVKQVLKQSQPQLYSSCPHHFFYSNFFTHTHQCAPPGRLTHSLFMLPLSSREKRPGGSNYKFCIAVTEITVVRSWFFCEY